MKTLTKVGVILCVAVGVVFAIEGEYLPASLALVAGVQTVIWSDRR